MTYEELMMLEQSSRSGMSASESDKRAKFLQGLAQSGADPELMRMVASGPYRENVGSAPVGLDGQVSGPPQNPYQVPTPGQQPGQRTPIASTINDWNSGRVFPQPGGSANPLYSPSAPQLGNASAPPSGVTAPRQPQAVPQLGNASAGPGTIPQINVNVGQPPQYQPQSSASGFDQFMQPIQDFQYGVSNGVSDMARGAMGGINQAMQPIQDFQYDVSQGVSSPNTLEEIQRFLAGVAQTSQSPDQAYTPWDNPRQMGPTSDILGLGGYGPMTRPAVPTNSVMGQSAPPLGVPTVHATAPNRSGR